MQDKNEKSFNINWYSTNYLNTCSKYWKINIFSDSYSVSIRRMRRFYEMYPIWSTVSTELSWAHFQELIRIERKEERKFYKAESIKSNWGCRELRRQINTSRYRTNANVCELLYELAKEEGEENE